MEYIFHIKVMAFDNSYRNDLHILIFINDPKFMESCPFPRLYVIIVTTIIIKYTFSCVFLKLKKL